MAAAPVLLENLTEMKLLFAMTGLKIGGHKYQYADGFLRAFLHPLIENWKSLSDRITHMLGFII